MPDPDSQTPAIIGSPQRRRTSIILLLLLLGGLPLAVWHDMQNMTASILQNQANNLDSMLTSIRGFYSSNIVNRVLTKHDPKNPAVAHNYEEIPGAIPIPATLSLELGQIISEKQSNLRYRFVSDYPFTSRSTHKLDALEHKALATFRANPKQESVIETYSKGLLSQVRYISPVVMGASCVGCHNNHPSSVKTDWKVGDIRGIQEVTVIRPVELNVLRSFKYSLAYFLLVAGAGAYFIMTQRRQNATIRAMNNELENNNNFLASISMKISRYLSPQVYKSIFSGAMDGSLKTTRKKLTIFFSDVKGFTEISERLQPEELTALINEYFTEMSDIALKHGGTIDKFIGDAILVFFGDPESRGVAEDAKACVRMALDMQDRLAALNVKWRKLGAEEPFRIRIGINTGFCNVGNFGSSDRMDYTILGAEANLAARLQTNAPPDGIVASYETYALVSDIVSARALPPMLMKGISREVVPYLIEGPLVGDGSAPIINEHGDGVDFYLNMEKMDAERSEKVREMLRQALAALEQRKK
ncbi:MAG: adenylate/guanylate cyclase domain-containing protein [Betaproteobacteria bacterium]|nr:adenylate/guanylate cyclase domain-containing protein [Betaproteobacteria bacterium]